jgi:hypothetical protein
VHIEVGPYVKGHFIHNGPTLDPEFFFFFFLEMIPFGERRRRGERRNIIISPIFGEIIISSRLKGP